MRKAAKAVAFLAVGLGLSVYFSGCNGCGQAPQQPQKTADSSTNDNKPLAPTPVPTPAREYPDEPIALNVSALELANGEAATIHIHSEGNREKPAAGDRVFLRFELKTEVGETLTPEPQEMSFELGNGSVFPSMEEAVTMLGVGATATIRLSPVPLLWMKFLPTEEQTGGTPEALLIEITRIPPVESAPSGE